MADRIQPPEIREVPIDGNRRCREVLSCWRGRSGRRYVVQVHELGTDWPVRAGAGLAFAVARNGIGQARIVDIAPGAPGPSWRGRMWDAGARELHVYILVDDEAGRAEVAMDLMPEAIANRPDRA
ncbi:hypothetical protein [Methylorubrum zatmanii]